MALNRNSRLSKLRRPDTNPDKYNDEEYQKNPLFQYNICEIKERRHYTFLKRKAIEEKIKVCQRKTPSKNLEDDAIPISEFIYKRKLFKCTERAPIPKMLHKTEQKILQYIPKHHKVKYPRIVEQYMTDVHNEFDTILKNFSLRKLLKPIDGGDNIENNNGNMQNNSSTKIMQSEELPFNFQRLGKTKKYHIFLRNRKKLQTNLLLPYPFLRCILHFSTLDFPVHLNDYSRYRWNAKGEKQSLSLYDFENVCEKDLQDNCVFLKKDWYPKIVRIMQKHYRKHTLPKSHWPKIMACASGLINRQINELKIRTFNHVLDVLLDRERIPYFKFQTICPARSIELFPNFNDIQSAFYKIFSDILDVGTKLPILESQIDRELFFTSSCNDYLPIEISDVYMSEMYKRLDDTLNIAYSSILEHLEEFQREYYDLYGNERLTAIENFLKVPREFEEYLSMIDQFNEYVTRLRKRVQNVYFDVATINQQKSIDDLRAIAENFIKLITANIVIAHKNDCLDICRIFESIKERALEIPRSTEMLLANGEHMLYVKTKQMFEIQDRIRESLRIGGLLVELTELPQNHLNLQILTINWFKNMNEIFDQNASLFENYKFQFEEHLQNVTKKLNEDIDELIPNLAIIDNMSETEKFREYNLILADYIEKLNCFDDYVKWINKEEKLFKFPITQYEILNDTKNYVIPFASLMKLCIRWLRHYYVWMDGPFEYLDPKFVETTIDEYYKEFLKIQKYYRNRIKQDMLGNPICKFRGQTEDPDPEKHPVPLRLCGKMLDWIKEFRVGVYIVNIMCNPALRTRHWDEMSEVATFDITPDAGTTLRKIMNYKIDNKLDGFEIISIGANKELQLQVNLAAMIKEWDTINFPTGPYKETNISILSNLDDVQALLDDHILKTLTMRGSAFVKPCETEVRSWYDKLLRVNQTFEEWGKVQANWLYLLPIFSSKDIVAQMPEEGRLFNQVDQTYRRYITMVLREPNVMKTAPAPGLLEAMEAANIMLEDITNGVNMYLETKRLYFPRFFFLSNDEMLEILSETRDPLRVQPHLNKCFEGIHRLHFNESLEILAMLSNDLERIEFVNKISTAEARGSVEKWLLSVENEMLLAVKTETSKSYQQYMTEKRIDWLLNWSQMIVLCISQIFWAQQVHVCLQQSNVNAMQSFYEQLQNDLSDIVNVIRSKSITNLNRITIKSLIVIDVHAKDVINELIKQNVHKEDDFQWLAQLRYYWMENGDVKVKIINATVNYANEYLGNSDRLVITPLTDRCYRTLIGAYQLHLNGAPEGPAGTGKTETTKDLAKALAVQCKVFNCSDGLDFKAMGKFFKGLASSGAWACFDEFNRIELEVLSVVAQQILCIIVAIRSNAKKFVFEGTELTLNPACYVCITMNPGYAGRSELPDNLKVLFRTVAMMVPDYAMIGEISLYSYGFINARTLAVKIVTTYRLCSEQLSSQNHYDYGMRAVKTVLSACGNIKLAFPDEIEDLLLLRALLDVNLPKFLSFDIPLFEGIISDLFPGIKLADADYSIMHTVFLEICNEKNLQPTKSFFTKIVQTYEMMIVRHGFMMVGESYAGKTKTLQTLAEMLEKLNTIAITTNPYYQKCKIGIVNPKSITMGQLYGAFDPISYEWTDGIASTMFRNFATDTTSDRKWLIFDGPVDAVWIENMNTVLDDNKKLCLTSGEVITMNNEMSIIFEVMDLMQASPATVSRCGMIYMEPKTLGYETFLKSWLNKCNVNWTNDWKTLIFDLFMWIIPQAINFVKRNCQQLLNSGEYNLLMTTFNLFEMIMNDAVDENPEDYSRYLFAWIQADIIYSVAWGIGGLLNIESREKFDVFYREIWQCTENNPPPASMLNKIEVSIPLEGQIIDYVYIFKQKGAWKYWPDLVRRLEPEIGPLGVQVATIDTGRYMHLLDLHIKHKKKILFVGPTGTGKSFYTQNTLMNKLNQDEYMAAFMTFTVMITANQTQELLLSKLLKHKRGRYGPPKGKTCVIFVDDMNMPAKEEYGAQPPIELLRQFFDYQYVYDLKDTSKIFINNLLVLCACGIPGGSRQNVYSRFLCHFDCFSINSFSDETITRIFSNVLLNGFKRGGHASDVMINVTQIVSATLNIYGTITRDLRPTPAKSHYIFNVRDIAKICLGCSLLKKESVDNKRIFTKIWFHETMRVFYDRLVDDADRSWFFVRISKTISEIFHDKIESLFEEHQQQQQQQQQDDCDSSARSESVTLDSVNKLLFGSYLDLDSEPGDRRYEEIPSFKQFHDIAQANLDEYNATHKTKMDIVLFSYALEHLNKICRIISMPAGNGMLVGMSGSGRQSLTRLAATICQQSVFQPEITKNYSISDWREDLKTVLKESGGLGKDTIFLVAENQIKHESFLTDIDCLLNLGEVPNIWPIDEKQEILEMVRLAAQGGNRNIDVNPLQVFSFFINRCKNKLHIILCFSPIGTAFRTRVRLYPSLVNCCTIDWYDAWPQQALEMIANKYISTINVNDDIKTSIVTACKHFHVTARGSAEDFQRTTGRITYITSASFLELIRSFTALIQSKQNEIMENKMRYIGGLETLVQAAETVAIMQKELNELQPKLIMMAENSKKMTAEIETKTVEASVATEQVKRDEIVANVQAAAAEAMEDECTKDLAQAVPVLEDALQALNTLKPTDITLVKSMKNPPNVVKLVMAAVCVMKGVPPDRINDPTTGKKILDYWLPSKRILGDMAFLQTLKDYEKDNINPDIMKKIRKDFIPNKDFLPKIVAKASSAAEGLCKWIIAIDRYDSVAKVVAPKQARLYAAKEVLKETRRFLAEKRALAEALESKVARLNEELINANAEKQRTEIEVELCKNKLQRAEALINGLGGEKSRWTQSAENLQYLYDRLAGDILISCAIIAYLSTLNMNYRQQCTIDWHRCCQELSIPCSDEYSLIDVLGTEIKIQNWNLAGLPRDSFSIENAIIMDSSSRFSLFIDPQGQANKWIKTYERNNRLQILKFSQPDYMKILEVCIEFGNPALIENVEEDLEAPLDPILARTTFVQGGIEYISVGDNILPLSSKFRLYITTNLRNPHYLPETFNKVSIINFALTQTGLEDQLLGIVVAKERPDLQELREKLIIESAANKTMLKNVEVNILKTLSKSKGDILEDESAIIILDNSKILSLEIIEKEASSRETSVKIESFRENYKLIAKHAALLYYCVTDLPNIDPMYQFSLNWYINLYVYSIENANKSKELQRRLKFLIDAVTQNLYNQVCRSIFEKDKLLFSFILTNKIMLASARIEQDELVFLMTGTVAGISNTVTPTISPDTTDTIVNIVNTNPDTSWITNKMWHDIEKLNQLLIFQNFTDNFRINLIKWKLVYDSNEPHLMEMPEPWENNLTKFQKLIILRAIRPDKLFVAITEFVRHEMGSVFVTPPQFDIAKSYEESNCLTPLIFILSPGADPMGALSLFAEKMGFDKGFQSISLGQGQGPIAAKLIETAQEQGAWICLQNCHLSASWMPTLEQIWEHMDIYNTNPTFRMWLTSYPSDKFPSMLLQNGIKITNEPPTGLQQNLLRSYQSEPMNIDSFYNGCATQHRAFTRLLYGICFFHAVVQERTKFGAMGWNIPYGFNESDFQISVQQLQMFLNQYKEIPYVAIAYLTGECNYGGRVTDMWDRRTIITILSDYVNSEVVHNPSYNFGESNIYVLPRKLEHREICKYIEKSIPNMANPEVFGLHSNAGITRNLNTSNQLITALQQTMGNTTLQSDKENEKQLLQIVNDIKLKLPNDFDIEICELKYPVDYTESMNTVLIQEMQRFNILLREIRETCIDLENSIKGYIVMTPDMEEICISIRFQCVPKKWMSKSYPSLKPIASYILDFVERLNWLNNWYENGKPSTFWISGFYFTQAFLTAALQNYARKYHIPIDSLTFDFKILQIMKLETAPNDGIYINGLYLDGARWNLEKCHIEEQYAKILIDHMPAIHIIPILAIELQEGTRYKCPLYKTAERKGILSTTGHSTNYVLPILLDTKKPSNHWIKRSAALLCQTND